jgi:hypothetical protein
MATITEERTAQGDFRAYAEPYQRDGVAFLNGYLDAKVVALVQAAYDWKLASPGPFAQWLYPDSGATYLQASGDSIDQPDFNRLLKDSPIAKIVADLFGSGDVWFIREQQFLKEGGSPTAISRRTPWHQDSSYLPLDGDKIAVMWIPVDPAPQPAALDVVRGSHKGTTYTGTMFDPNDDTTPIYTDDPLPRLPDIEADRGRWNSEIVSSASSPGDALIFHTASLHGGAATLPGMRRRSLTARFVGDDVVGVTRPKIRPDLHAFANRDEVKRKHGDDIEDTSERYERLPIGAPLWQSGIRKVHPWPLSS